MHESMSTLVKCLNKYSNVRKKKSFNFIVLYSIVSSYTSVEARGSPPQGR